MTVGKLCLDRQYFSTREPRLSTSPSTKCSSGFAVEAKVKIEEELKEALWQQNNHN